MQGHSQFPFNPFGSLGAQPSGHLAIPIASLFQHGALFGSAPAANTMAALGPSPSAILAALGSQLQPGPPVGQCINDEELLVQALREGKAENRNRRLALEALHSVHGHTAWQWKDYYLEHGNRLDAQVSLHQAAPNANIKSVDQPADRTWQGHPQYAGPAAKKPIFDVDDEDYQPPREQAKKLARTVDDQRATRSILQQEIDDGPRATRAKVRMAGRMTSKKSSPVPPGGDAPRKRGGRPKGKKRQNVRYTDAHKNYFIKYACYRLAQNPNTSMRHICNAVARKVKGHSASSWNSQYSVNHKYYDAEIRRALAQPAENAVTGVMEPLQEDDDAEGDDDSDDDDVIFVSPPSNAENSRRPFTDEELSEMAKYVASFNNYDWGNMAANHRWEHFASSHPGRSGRAYADAHNCHVLVINDKVNYYRKAAQPGPSTLRARRLSENSDDGADD